MKLESRLTFEVTRKCNMNCKHCLRGKCEQAELTKEMVDETLKHFEAIKTLTFTGGEPTLNVEIIIYIIDKIMEKGIPVYAFFIALNGKIYSPELVLKLIDFYSYISILYDGAEYCELCLSLNDNFHEEIEQENIIKYKALKFYSTDKEGEITKYQVIDKGNATINGIGYNKPTVITSIDAYIEDDIIYCEGLVYINALGEVLLDCNLSYGEQNYFSIGNVLEKDLDKIILEEIEEEE